MYCAKCNEYIPAGLDLRFCPSCGIDLEKATAEKRAEERARQEKEAVALAARAKQAAHAQRVKTAKYVFIGLALFVGIGLLVYSIPLLWNVVKRPPEPRFTAVHIEGKSRIRRLVHEPKDSTMSFVPFSPQLVKVPIEVNYPSSWFVAEETIGGESLFISREPIRRDEDKFIVGMHFIYKPDMFRSQKWEDLNQSILEDFPNQGLKVISSADGKVGGMPAFKIENETDALRGVFYHVKLDDDLLILSYQAPHAEYKHYEETFSKMLKSLTFSEIQEEEPEHINQEPKGSSDKLIDFAPRLMDMPFRVAYPENWYAREEYHGKGNAKLLLTREPVRKSKDEYEVGMEMTALPNFYFGKADDWEKQKSEFLDAVEQEGITVTDTSDMNVSGKHAFRMDFESEKIKAISLNLKLGNHLYIFGFRSPRDEFDAYKDVFERMIRSLSLETVRKEGGVVDPVVQAILSKERYDVRVNGELKEGVLVRDVLREAIRDGQQQDVSEERNIDGEKKDAPVEGKLMKGVVVFDPFGGVVVKGGEEGGTTALVNGLDFKFDDRNWRKKVHTATNPEVIQYFLPDEDHKNWSEVVTIHKLTGNVGRFTPRAIAEKMRGAKSAVVNIISESDKDLVYEGYTNGGQRYELVRVISGKGVIYTLYYASRNMDTVVTEREEWLKLLRSAKIV